MAQNIDIDFDSSGVKARLLMGRADDGAIACVVGNRVTGAVFGSCGWAPHNAVLLSAYFKLGNAFGGVLRMRGRHVGEVFISSGADGGIELMVDLPEIGCCELQLDEGCADRVFSLFAEAGQ